MGYKNFVNCKKKCLISKWRCYSVLVFYKRGCLLCDFPYQYILRTETFHEDYQFILRKAGLWDTLDEKHKRVGAKKGKNFEQRITRF